MLTTTATELPRLMRCIGSRLMPAALPPDYDREQRDEGNAAHWLAQHLFEGGAASPGTKAPNGYVITDDMVEHVHTYLGALYCGQMEVETTFAGETWEVRARADHIKYHDGVLTIDDFKYGWRIVEPRENWTLLAHAVGWCMRNINMDQNVYAPHTIILRIHQPRPYHPDGPTREWRVPRDYIGLIDAYQQINDRLTHPDDTLTTGLAQCAKCHALATCPAARAASMNAIDTVQSMAFTDDLPNEVLAHEYEVLDQAEAMVKAVRDARAELMMHRIKSGQVVHNYWVEPRKGNRAWIPGMTGKTLTAATGVDLAKDGIVTPAEAERRGVPKTVLAALTNRPMIGEKLSRIDPDAIGRRIFGDR